MERKTILPISSEIEEGDNADSFALIQRRQAIQSFLRNPTATLQSYPQLSDDLLRFFSQTANPHVSDETGLPVPGRQADFEQWEAAQSWARTFFAAMNK